MDLFAVILVTITVITICGICLFIFVCALQPKLLSKLHGKSSRTYQDTNPNEIEDHRSVKSLDLPIESSTENSLSQSNGRDKKAYLKSLEQSLRTGGKIEDEGGNDNNESYSNPLCFICRFINKRLRRTATDNNES